MRQLYDIRFTFKICSWENEKNLGLVNSLILKKEATVYKEGDVILNIYAKQVLTLLIHLNLYIYVLLESQSNCFN
jgi:hypothetical protein